MAIGAADTVSEKEAPAFQPWSAGEREDFLDAIARHRKAAWRVTAVCALASGVLAIVASLLLAPLLYCLLGLALDVVNWVVPMPDLLSFAGRAIEPFIESEPRPRVMGAPWVVAFALLPGLALIALAVRTLKRALRQSPLFNPELIVGRAPEDGVLAEQRMRNTIEEMAVAAGIPAPRVMIVEGGANAAAFGPDEAHATVVIGSALLDSLKRDEMQGVAGHLVSSIADGDMGIGMRTALTLGLFALYARLGSGFGDQQGFAATRRLLRALIWPTPGNTEYILRQLSEPFSDVDGKSDDRRPTPGEAHAQAVQHLSNMKAVMAGETPPVVAAEASVTGASHSSNKLTWRQWAMMPLVGPVVLAGFLCGMVSTMMLTPLIALAWRQRKYMADATAVKLTRHPDGLAGALVAIANRGATRMALWAGHLCVVDPGTKTNAGLLGSWGSSIAFPSLAKRYQALQRLGATPLQPEQREALKLGAKLIPLPLKLVLTVALGVVGVLMCVVVVGLVWVSVAMTGLFLILPVSLLHALLR